MLTAFAFIMIDTIAVRIRIANALEYTSISMILSYVLLLCTKKFQMSIIFYLKLKSKYGPLVGYKGHQKFDDFDLSLCRK